tara:strand:+ start:520 stop:1209 length:690 start_codon:yes stop_codon:yes gene_type:complete
MEDETLEDLMPVINPNLDEVVSENVFKPVEDKPPKNNEIFICSNKKVKKLQELQELQDDEKCKLQEPIKVEVKEKKKYPHLEKARATALANRQRKAKAKADLKELENTKKLELKEEKKKLRVEKNRTNARNNYHKKQEAKALLEAEEKDVWKESITNDKPTPTKTGLSYDEFEKYMDTYNKKKPKPVISKPKPVVSKPVVSKPVVSNHPVNYYNPHQRNKIDMDDLFSL